MKRTWEALAGWEVDGVEIEVDGSPSDPDWFTASVDWNGSFRSCSSESDMQSHRSTLMLVVDALEATGGKAMFSRVPQLPDMPNSPLTPPYSLGWKYHSWPSISERISDHGDNEAEALGALLERVREALGG